MSETIGKLSVVVTAVDRASSTINRIDTGLSRIPATAGRLQSAFARVGEMPGLSRVSSGLSHIRSEAAAAGRSIATAAVPLAGAGLAAGAAASLSSFMDLGKQLQTGSRRLGMSVGDLHAFRNAVTLAGRDADEAQEGFVDLDRALYDAGRGQNPGLAGLIATPDFNLGSLRDAQGQITRATEMAPKLFDLLRRLRNAPNEQEQVARAAGAEWMRPLANQYANLQEAMRRGRRLGVFDENQVAQSVELRKEWIRLGAQGAALGDQVGAALTPVLLRGARATNQWTEANRDWLTTSIAERVEQVGGNASKGAALIDQAVRNTIGWTAAVDLLSVALGVRLVGAVTGVRLSMLALGASKIPLWALRLLGVAGLGVAGVAGLNRLGDWQKEGLRDRPEVNERRKGTLGGPSRAGGYYPPVNPGPVPQDLANLIGQAEGTDRARGYNETLGYGAYTGGPRNLTSMSLSDIDKMQSEMLRHPANTLNSSAVGRYQITQTTLRGLMRDLNLNGTEKFDAGMQDRLMTALAERRGLREFKAGQITAGEFQSRLSQEWASIPDPRTGQGYYANQRRPGVAQGAIDNVLRREREPAPPAQVTPSHPAAPALVGSVQPQVAAVPREVTPVAEPLRSQVGAPAATPPAPVIPPRAFLSPAPPPAPQAFRSSPPAAPGPVPAPAPRRPEAGLGGWGAGEEDDLTRDYQRPPRAPFSLPQPAPPMALPQGEPLARGNVAGDAAVKMTITVEDGRAPRVTTSSTGGVQVAMPEVRSTFPSHGV